MFSLRYTDNNADGCTFFKSNQSCDEHHSTKILSYEQILMVIALHRNSEEFVGMTMSAVAQQFLAALIVIQF